MTHIPVIGLTYIGYPDGPTRILRLRGWAYVQWAPGHIAARIATGHGLIVNRRAAAGPTLVGRWRWQRIGPWRFRVLRPWFSTTGKN